ncbi:MAG TPA: methyltransferase domain-containing protein [bacterium]|nr:methyltransferase domain-containing protein [bacterium]HPN32144.1 methyltransferase domain-containing protein [bacterium]
MGKYVHGYSKTESKRLTDQANTLERIIHSDTLFKKGSVILEAGCGTGAQTIIMAKKNPDCQFISVDISKESIAEAKKRIKSANIKNVIFKNADITDLNFKDNYFDYAAVCFVLEHLSNVDLFLRKLKKIIKNRGKIMVIEGDHGSTYFYPDSKFAAKTINCQIELQKQSGGNANIGRELFFILNRNYFQNVDVSPRMVYVDPDKPDLINGFTKNTFIAMIEGVKENAIKQKIITEKGWEKGIADLYKTAGGVFCYTFFKAWADNIN